MDRDIDLKQVRRNAYAIFRQDGLDTLCAGYDSGWVVAFQLWTLAMILVPVGALQCVWLLRKYQGPVQEIPNGPN